MYRPSTVTIALLPYERAAGAAYNAVFDKLPNNLRFLLREIRIGNVFRQKCSTANLHTVWILIFASFPRIHLSSPS